MITFEKPQNATVALMKVNRELEERDIVENSKLLGVGYANFSKIPINPDVLKLISKDEAIQAGAIPFFQVGKKVRVGFLDHHQENAKNMILDLQDKGYQVNINLISESSYKEAIAQYDEFKYAPLPIVENVIDQEIKDGNVEMFKNFDDKKTYEIVNEIFVKALTYDASDIHLEPHEKVGVVRFRIDGMMTTVSEMDLDLFAEVIMQVKHLAKLKLNVSLRPQDGRTFFVVNQQKIDVRVSSLPCHQGEDIVMRILDSRSQKLKLSDLGLQDDSKLVLEKSLTAPTGMILVTGPTGSGKTTTLYSILEHLHTGKTKIITLEDPIEYHLDGVTQSQIDEEENYNFHNGLRSILRQDPDVIMVGEIRDKQTAEVASQASLTGHKVLSTLHTKSSVATISRLLNMGIEPFLIAPSLEMIIAQRLVRKICPNCQIMDNVSQEMKDYLKTTIKTITEKTGKDCVMPEVLPSAKGCDYCNHTGYKGRVGIYEIMPIDDKIRHFILNQVSEMEIRDYVYQQGMLSLFEYGVIKVLQGVTTLEEVYRVVHD